MVTVREALALADSLMSRRNRRRLLLAVGTLIATNLLDLVGVLLMGATAAMIAALVAPPGSGGPTLAGSYRPWFVPAEWSPTMTLLAMAGLATVVLAVKSVLAFYLNGRILRFMANREVDFASGLLARYFAAPHAAAQQLTSQEVITGVSVGSRSLASIVSQLSTALSDVVLVAALSLLLLVASPLLFAFAAIYFTAMTLVVSAVVGKRTQLAQRASSTASLAASEATGQAIGLTRELRVYGLSAQYRDDIRTAQHAAAHANAYQTWWSQAPRYVLESALLFGLGLAALITLLTESPERAAFAMGMYVVASARLLPSIQRINTSWALIRGALGSLERIDSLMALPGAPTRDADGSTLLPADGRAGAGGHLVLDHVTYRYPTNPAPALCDVTVSVALPARIAIVGPSGAGKSTLADVLLGLLEADEGTVRLDMAGGRGARVAFVAQDVFLMPGDVRANVSLALPGDDVDDDQVWEALEVSAVADVVRELPEGLNTRLRERGTRLSGGQRQRLGLARALYRHPDVLVLDEATSSLDADTERAVTDALEAIPGDISVVTIAHRLATIRSADVVLYLREGHLVDSGRFDDLVERHPDLAKTATIQGLTRS